MENDLFETLKRIESLLRLHLFVNADNDIGVYLNPDEYFPPDANLEIIRQIRNDLKNAKYYFQKRESSPRE